MAAHNAIGDERTAYGKFESRQLSVTVFKTESITKEFVLDLERVFDYNLAVIFWGILPVPIFMECNMTEELQSTYAGVSSKAVLAATDKNWESWFAVLDAANAITMSHKDIAIYLSREQHVGDWWCQMITVGYEQARGLREKHQMTDGYKISRSRPLNVPPKVAYEYWIETGRRTRWLPHPIEIRKQTPLKSLRVTWVEDQTYLNVSFYEKGAEKTQVVVEHTKLTDAEDAETRKAFWTTALEKLENRLKETI
jgi:hypothetical protein